VCHESVGHTRHNGEVAARTKTSVSRAKERTREMTRAIARPTPAGARLSHRPAIRTSFRLGGAVLAFEVVLSLFVLPVKAYFEQRDVYNKKTAEFDALADANEQLQNEVNDLSTPEGIRNAARTQLGYVLPGEQKLAFAQTPELPTELPAQWPYTLVTGIVAVRSQVATANGGSALQSHLP